MRWIPPCIPCSIPYGPYAIVISPRSSCNTAKHTLMIHRIGCCPWGCISIPWPKDCFVRDNAFSLCSISIECSNTECSDGIQFCICLWSIWIRCLQFASNLLQRRRHTATDSSQLGLVRSNSKELSFLKVSGLRLTFHGSSQLEYSIALSLDEIVLKLLDLIIFSSCQSQEPFASENVGQSQWSCDCALASRNVDLNSLLRVAVNNSWSDSFAFKHFSEARVGTRAKLSLPNFSTAAFRILCQYKFSNNKRVC